MTERSEILIDSDGLSRHILPVSATLMGVCVTLVGLVKVVEAKIGSSHVDEYARSPPSFFWCVPFLPIFRSAARPTTG